MGFNMYNDVYFIMGPNTLMIMQKALFRKKIITYNPGEIERVDFNYNYGYQYDDDGGGYMHSYTLNVVLKNGKTNNYYNLSSSSKEFTNEEIAYFLYFINSHIRTKMFAQNFILFYYVIKNLQIKFLMILIDMVKNLLIYKK